MAKCSYCDGFGVIYSKFDIGNFDICEHCSSHLDRSKYDDRDLQDIPKDYESYPPVPVPVWVDYDGFPSGTAYELI